MVIGESKRDPRVRRRSHTTHTTHTSKKILATPTAIIALPGNRTASSLIHRTPTRPSTHLVSTPCSHHDHDSETALKHRQGHDNL